MLSSRCRVCRTCVVSRNRSFASVRISFARKETALTLSHSCSPPSPLPPPLYSVASFKLRSSARATSPRLPITRVSSGDYCYSASGGRGRSPPTPPPRASGVPVVVSRRERKGNGRDGRNGGVNAAAAASSFTTSFWSNNVLEHVALLAISPSLSVAR